MAMRIHFLCLPPALRKAGVPAGDQQYA